MIKIFYGLTLKIFSLWKTLFRGYKDKPTDWGWWEPEDSKPYLQKSKHLHAEYIENSLNSTVTKKKPISKMGKKLEQTLHQRRHMVGKRPHKKCFSIICLK